MGVVTGRISCAFIVCAEIPLVVPSSCPYSDVRDSRRALLCWVAAQHTTFSKGVCTCACVVCMVGMCVAYWNMPVRNLPNGKKK